MEDIIVSTYPRHRGGNVNDITFLVHPHQNVNPASHIHIELHMVERGLVYSQEIDNSRRSGLRTYNGTINSNNTTLSSVPQIREAIIERFGLPVNHRYHCQFTVLEDQTHVFKIYVVD